jgi:hypothetical protein
MYCNSCTYVHTCIHDYTLVASARKCSAVVPALEAGADIRSKDLCHVATRDRLAHDSRLHRLIGLIGAKWCAARITTRCALRLHQASRITDNQIMSQMLKCLAV